jgi:abequosyltransferase
MTPHLSICIATLNRARFLKETLARILGQASDEVEVVIVDGASSDGTEEVVRG